MTLLLTSFSQAANNLAFVHWWTIRHFICQDQRQSGCHNRMLLSKSGNWRISSACPGRRECGCSGQSSWTYTVHLAKISWPGKCLLFGYLDTCI